jgi:hypothetical protein
MITQSIRDRLVDRLWLPNMPSRTEVWMILDAARDPTIFGAVDATYLVKSCLYAGELPWQMKMVAPYLVELKKGHAFTQFAVGQGWGKAWGIFLRTGADLKALRRHLRRFLTVRGPMNERLVFRYYDPRVLRLYLPTCTPEELRTVYGPIDHYLMEDDDPGTLLEYGLDENVLAEKRVTLEVKAQSA